VAGEDGGPVRALDGLSPKAALVYEALPASGSVGVAELSEGSGLPIGAVRGALPVLELAGLVASDGTGWFRRG
jgi:DNA processing protein